MKVNDGELNTSAGVVCVKGQRKSGCLAHKFAEDTHTAK